MYTLLFIYKSMSHFTYKTKSTMTNINVFFNGPEGFNNAPGNTPKGGYVNPDQYQQFQQSMENTRMTDRSMDKKTQDLLRDF